jgi:hypothetical protein
MQGLHLVAKRLVGVWKRRILGDTLIALFSPSGSWKFSRKPIDKDHKEVAVSYVCARKKRFLRAVFRHWSVLSLSDLSSFRLQC